MDISLIPTNVEFAELWHKWRAEPNTVRYNPVLPTPVDKLKERMANMGSDFTDLKAYDEYQFFIKADTHLVGTVSLKNISHMMMYGEIGYDVGQSMQGKGIGTKAVSLFVEKIFAETEMRRLIAYVAQDNGASRKILEKIGFVKEGLCREHFIINGKPTNEILYGLLRSDLKAGAT